jgi:hypothetical protein
VLQVSQLSLALLQSLPHNKTKVSCFAGFVFQLAMEWVFREVSKAR